MSIRAKWVINTLMTRHGLAKEEPFPEELTSQTCEASQVPDGIPHVVLVSHNIFLTELYEVLRDWNIGEHRWTGYSLRNAEW